MGMEAELLAKRIDTPDPEARRAPADRRGPDRRRTGSRINTEVPGRSLLKGLGAFGVGISAAIIVLTLLAGEMLGTRTPTVVLAFEAAALFTSVLLLALGSMELRLIEIRLELMMMNGGRRGNDRRKGARRAD